MGLTREEVEVRGAAYADEKIVHMLTRELTLSKEMLKTISRVVGRLDEAPGCELKGMLGALGSIKREIEGLRRDLLTYISKVSPGLYHREDWLRISSKVYGVVDKLSGIGYRLDYLISKGWKVTPEVRERLSQLASSIEGMIDLFFLMLTSLTQDLEGVARKYEEINALESTIDEHFRRTTFTILESNLSFSTVILLLKVSEMLEEVSDALCSAGDDLYMIALGMR